MHTDTDEIWNRSRALNIGIQAATGQIVMCTDCDMIFAPDFLKTALDTISDSDGQTLVLCACRDLPESLAEQRWSVDDFPRLLQAAPSYRKGGGTGACQVACRQWFVDVRGYDEKYVFWGYEDKNLVRRASKSGLALRWIHDRTQMLHQWHPTTKFDRLWRRRLNRLRYKLTGGVVRKNRSGWGTLDR